MKVLHFSDLHLDHAFLDDDFSILTGRERRETLKAILADICALARSESADVVTVAGDLFDAETIMPATLTMLSEAFADLAPIPVLIAPGLSDLYGADSLYARWSFPDNVHVFRSEMPTAYNVEPGFTVWGMAVAKAPLYENLHRIRLQSGVNLFLAHIAEASSLKTELAAVGIDYALLGGEHCYREFDGGVYPGSPEVLEPHLQACSHGVAVLTITPDSVSVRHIETGRWSYATHEIDVSNCANENDLEQLIQATIDQDGDDQRLHTVILTGEPRCAIRIDQLQNRLRGYVTFSMRLRPPYDLDALASEPTVRGLLVSRCMEQMAAMPSDQHAHLLNKLQLALQALDGIEVPYNAIDPD
ncbi:MAG: metallophosphoesterase [Chloroflexota bacterium]